jgi:hypothetical protein
MKYLITESQKDKVVGKYLTNLFDTLGKFKSEKYPVGTFYANNNGKIIAEVYKSTHSFVVVIDYDVWSHISDLFGFGGIREMQDSISKWADNYFGYNNTLVDFGEYDTIDDI